MDPRHRDRIAFIRVVSGKFERNMTAINTRTGKNIRLAYASKLFGQERETVEEAYPGDVVGIVGNADLGIGDTVAEDSSISFDEIPRFAPECFSYAVNPTPSQYKPFRKGIRQLLQERVVQRYELVDADRSSPLLGAVGPLQFEIVQSRLESEYGASSRMESAPWTVTRWLHPDIDPDDLTLPRGANLATDEQEQLAILFPNDWSLRHFQKRNPDRKSTRLNSSHYS